MHVLEPDTTLHILRYLALGRLGVDFRRGIEQPDDIGRSRLGRGDIGDEREDVSGLNSREGRRLYTSDRRDMISLG